MQLSYLGVAMACCMHIITGAREKIILFSEVSWQKFITSVHQWKSTDTREAEIAQNAINTFGLELVRAPEILDAVPCQARYHRKCCMRYTDECKIARARKKPALVPQSSDQWSGALLGKRRPETEGEKDTRSGRSGDLPLPRRAPTRGVSILSSVGDAAFESPSGARSYLRGVITHLHVKSPWVRAQNQASGTVRLTVYKDAYGSHLGPRARCKPRLVLPRCLARRCALQQLSPVRDVHVWSTSARGSFNRPCAEKRDILMHLLNMTRDKTKWLPRSDFCGQRRPIPGRRAQDPPVYCQFAVSFARKTRTL
uniref:uncharacterized protein n=1 Tax=Myxine glutinosa TaxID=7769 RepID=UPI00359014BC